MRSRTYKNFIYKNRFVFFGVIFILFILIVIILVAVGMRPSGEGSPQISTEQERQALEAQELMKSSDNPEARARAAKVTPRELKRLEDAAAAGK